MTLVAATSLAQAQHTTILSNWLRYPLITGASVSADYASLSPGKKLALRFTEDKNIRTVAKGGNPGRQSIQALQSRHFDDRSIIFALDFFFWDSTLAATGPSIAALEKLIAEAARRNLPIVLGDIPALLPPAFQPGRAKLNAEISRSCASYANCYVLSFDKMHRELMQNGYWSTQGKKLGLRDIVPDGLHIGSQAGELLADELQALLLSRAKI